MVSVCVCVCVEQTLQRQSIRIFSVVAAAAPLVDGCGHITCTEQDDRSKFRILRMRAGRIPHADDNINDDDDDDEDDHEKM